MLPIKPSACKPGAVDTETLPKVTPRRAAVLAREGHMHQCHTHAGGSVTAGQLEGCRESRAFPLPQEWLIVGKDVSVRVAEA